jgi:uncharacterized protein (DUF952 family)
LILAPFGAFILSWVVAIAAGTLAGPRKLLVHFASAREWEEAQARGEPYRRSTLGVPVEAQGFIHCAFPRQLRKVADAIVAGEDDVVLLFIDTGRLTAEVRVEPRAGDGSEKFPHNCGPLDVDAVIGTVAVPVRADGHLDLRAAFAARPGDFYKP